jgi:transcriptional regulator with XRE-family HTH domain
MESIEIEEVVISDRIKAVRKAKKLTQSKFGAQIEVGQDAISDYENGRNQPGERIIKALIKEYSINPDWLEHGVGNMFAQSEAIHATGTPQKYISGKKAQLYLSQLPDKDAELYIPYYDVEITAGTIEQYFDDIEEVPEGYIYAPQYRNCIACNVKGDSMYDRIYPGSRLYVYHLPNRKYIDFG